MMPSLSGSNHGAPPNACQRQRLAIELYRIIWSEEAIASLEHIVDYIEVFDPDAAARLAQRILNVADTLARFPDRGRPVANDLREMMTLVPYIIRYRVNDDSVEIIRVRHSAQGEGQV